MLTEVDTRDMAGQSVSLFMDTDAQVYLVCVEGYEPITCLTRERALMAYKHPWVYMPLEGSVSPPNATEGGSEGISSSGSLTARTGAVMTELRDVLEMMDDREFHWAADLIADVIFQMGLNRSPRPYNQEDDLRRDDF
jgi:hypothetical protein